jgi:hypothetical protein
MAITRAGPPAAGSAPQAASAACQEEASFSHPGILLRRFLLF